MTGEHLDHRGFMIGSVASMEAAARLAQAQTAEPALVFMIVDSASPVGGETLVE